MTKSVSTKNQSTALPPTQQRQDINVTDGRVQSAYLAERRSITQDGVLESRIVRSSAVCYPCAVVVASCHLSPFNPFLPPIAIQPSLPEGHIRSGIEGFAELICDCMPHKCVNTSSETSQRRATSNQLSKTVQDVARPASPFGRIGGGECSGGFRGSVTAVPFCALIIALIRLSYADC